MEPFNNIEPSEQLQIAMEKVMQIVIQKSQTVDIILPPYLSF